MASTVMETPPVKQTADSGMRFGHPRGLSTLFFTEVWERFSYYGMRALLVLFMTAAASGANAGLGMDVKTSTAIYGLYTSLVYLLALPGGWVADKLWGQQRTVFILSLIHISEPTRRTPISYAVFCLKKKTNTNH